MMDRQSARHNLHQVREAGKHVRLCPAAPPKVRPEPSPAGLRAQEVQRMVRQVLGEQASIAEGVVTFYADQLLDFIQQHRGLRVGVSIFAPVESQSNESGEGEPLG